MAVAFADGEGHPDFRLCLEGAALNRFDYALLRLFRPPRLHVSDFCLVAYDRISARQELGHD